MSLESELGLALKPQSTLEEKTQEMFGLDPNVVRRGSILPIVETAQGETEFGAPQFLVDMAQSFMLPGHVAEGGEWSPEQATQMAVDYGIWGAGAGAALAPEGALAVGAGKAPALAHSKILVGTDPYKIAKEQGLPIDAAPDSYMFDDKVFHPDIRYDPNLAEYPQVMGGTSVIAVTGKNGKVKLYNAFGEGTPTIYKHNLPEPEKSWAMIPGDDSNLKTLVDKVQNETAFKGYSSTTTHIIPEQVEELNKAAAEYLSLKMFAQTPESVQQTVQELSTLADVLGWTGENTRMLGLGGNDLEFIPDLIRAAGPGRSFDSGAPYAFYTASPRGSERGIALGSGTGSMAHEFGHAFDQYMRIRFMKNSPFKFATDEPQITQAVFKSRPEVRRAYAELTDRLFSGDFAYASKVVDDLRLSNYYSQPTEMFARTFDQYVYSKLKAQGIELPPENNLYTSPAKVLVDSEEQLAAANSALENLYKAEDTALPENKKLIQDQQQITIQFIARVKALQKQVFNDYPIPLGQQRQEINRLMDQFFSTVKVVKEYTPQGQPKYELWMAPAAATAGGLAIAGQSGEAEAGPLEDILGEPKGLEGMLGFGPAPTKRYFEEYTTPKEDFDMPAAILALEGGIQTQGYVPPDSNMNSGVTIGGGIDLGQMNMQDLGKLGLGKALYSKLTPYLGTKGQAAIELAKENPLLLSQEEATKITRAKMAYDKKQLSDEFNKDSWFLKYAQLPRPIQIVMESLKHHYGNVSQSWPTIWQMAQNADYPGIASELEKNQGEFRNRRLKEAAIIRKYLR